MAGGAARVVEEVMEGAETGKAKGAGRRGKARGLGGAGVPRARAGGAVVVGGGAGAGVGTGEGAAEVEGRDSKADKGELPGSSMANC